MTTLNPLAPQGISAPEPAVRCALCLHDCGRWYYGGDAPFCPRCWGRPGGRIEGPVRNPLLWELKAGQVPPAARAVWEEWAASGELTTTAPKETSQ